MLELKLPYPPSVNHYWDQRGFVDKKTKRPGVIKFLTARAKQFRIDVQQVVNSEYPEHKPITGPVAIEVIQHYGPPKEKEGRITQTQDIDNCLKPLFDALEHASVFENDRQIAELYVIRKRRAVIGHVIVKIHDRG